ncbi:hypothetical protein [Paucilactobacillus sp. N302-9]
MIPLPSSVNPNEVKFVNGELVFTIENPTNEQIKDLEQFNKDLVIEDERKRLPYL